MLLGNYFLKRLLIDKELYKLTELNPKWLIDKEEKENYKRIIEYVKSYGELPPPSFLDIDLFEELYPLDYYYDKLRERYIWNRLQILNNMIEGNESQNVIMTYLSSLLHDTGCSRVEYGDSLLATLINDIENARSAYFSDGLIGLETGYPALDFAVGGYQRGDVTVWSGRPKMGKTMFLIYSSNHLLNKGKKVLFITMEMTKNQILRRFVSLRTKTNNLIFLRGDITSYNEFRFVEAINDIKDRLFIVQGQLSKNINSLSFDILSTEPDIVFIDGAYLLTSSKRYLHRWEEISEIISNIKTIAITFNLPIVCSFQLNRATRRDNIALEHLALADAIGQIASYVLGVVDTDVESIKRIELIATREGMCRHFHVNWDWDRMNFSQIPDKYLDTGKEVIEYEDDEEEVYTDKDGDKKDGGQGIPQSVQEISNDNLCGKGNECG